MVGVFVWGEVVVPLSLGSAAFFAVGAALGGAGAQAGAVDAVLVAAFAGAPDFGVFAVCGVEGFVWVVDGPVAVVLVDGSGFACHASSLPAGLGIGKVGCCCG